MASTLFYENTWPELQNGIDKGALAILPLGMVEEHGPHMAVGADTMIAEDICKDIVKAFDNENDVPPIYLLPTFWAGYNMKIVHKWPGSLSVRPSVLLQALTDICVSLAKMGFYRIVLVNGHGNHDGIMRQLVRDIADECNVWMAAFDVCSFMGPVVQEIRKSPPGGICHAGEYETSVMMHYNRPVDTTKFSDEDIMTYTSKFVPTDGFSGSKKVVWSTWCLQDSKNGAYGDPTLASKEMGKQLVEKQVKESVEFLKEYCTQTQKR